MPKNKQPENTACESIERAYLENGEIGACEAAILKYAKVLDMTDSGRDIKPLVSGMFEMIDRLKSLEATNDERKGETPLFMILNAANQ